MQIEQQLFRATMGHIINNNEALERASEMFTPETNGAARDKFSGSDTRTNP